jgi:hypothetical protein
MGRRPSLSRFAPLAAAALALAPAAPAEARTCAERPVWARGESSRFETLAKAKVRANWRAKVRAMADLGAAYADFDKALAAEYQCTESEGRHVCSASAYPCRD